jgi:RNA polymerase sigma factor (sigma-70 family)
MSLSRRLPLLPLARQRPGRGGGPDPGDFAAFWESTARLPEAGGAPLDLKAWLYGIARNRWRKRCRAGGPASASLEEALELPDRAPGPEAALLAAMDAGQVAQAVADLPADYREALVLRVFEELSYSQLAAALGISEGLARWRVHQARNRLRARLGGSLALPGEREGKEASGAPAA